MKLTVNPKICVELVAADHSLIVSTEDAVIIRCTFCGGIKDLMCFMQSLPINYSPDGMRWCQCQGDRNAPHDGGDRRKLLAYINTMLGKCQTVEDARQLIIEIAMEQPSK
jgi:hypothetical protein